MKPDTGRQVFAIELTVMPVVDAVPALDHVVGFVLHAVIDATLKVEFIRTRT